MNSELQNRLSEYDRLFASGSYEKAAQYADTILRDLYVAEQIDTVKRIVQQTISTASNGQTISSAWLTLGDLLYRDNIYDKARACYTEGLKKNKMLRRRLCKFYSPRVRYNLQRLCLQRFRRYHLKYNYCNLI